MLFISVFPNISIYSFIFFFFFRLTVDLLSKRRLVICCSPSSSPPCQPFSRPVLASPCMVWLLFSSCSVLSEDEVGTGVLTADQTVSCVHLSFAPLLPHEEIILNVSLCFLSVAVTRKLYLCLLLVDSDISDILEVSSGGFWSFPPGTQLPSWLRSPSPLGVWAPRFWDSLSWFVSVAQMVLELA